VLAEILGGVGGFALIGFALKLISTGRELGKLEQRLAQAEEKITANIADGAACAVDRRQQAVSLAGVRSDIDHTRADVARAMAKDG